MKGKIFGGIIIVLFILTYLFFFTNSSQPSNEAISTDELNGEIMELINNNIEFYVEQFDKKIEEGEQKIDNQDLDMKKALTLIVKAFNGGEYDDYSTGYEEVVDMLSEPRSTKPLSFEMYMGARFFLIHTLANSEDWEKVEGNLGAIKNDHANISEIEDLEKLIQALKVKKS